MKERIFYVGLIILVIAGLMFMRNNGGEQRAEVLTAYDLFAQCLADKEVKFYGAFWCPHCQAQKKALQNSKKLPYIECSTADGKNMNQICLDKEIKGYPTWDFADGTRIDKEMTVQELSDKTGCALPQV